MVPSKERSQITVEQCIGGKTARSGGRWPEPLRTPSGVDRALNALGAVGLALFANGMVMGLGVLVRAI